MSDIDINFDLIKFMSKVERDMDDKTIEFVIFENRRIPVTDEICRVFDLRPKQTVNKIIMEAIIKFSIKHHTESTGAKKDGK